MKTVSFPESRSAIGYDLICFSHLRWNFVYQRPQHLLARFAQGRNVLYIEEPMFHDGEPKFVVDKSAEGVRVAVPHLPNGIQGTEHETELRSMVSRLLEQEGITNFVAWYYTPMMLGWSDHIDPQVVVYDCMDELSAFKNAPPELRAREADLFGLSDLVFTGGRSLFEVKRDQHKSVHCFPSSIDVAHFAQALSTDEEPEDQRAIPHPRIGFAGVIDERTDIDLLAAIADARPDWNYVMIGPVVKIDEADLPRRENIHYLGGKDYKDLPAYIGGWDVAMMPFAMNESTRFISPTKTPEYLAAGRPVVSTPIHDVIRPYGENDLVLIASTPNEFVDAIDRALSMNIEEHRSSAAEFLSGNSWDSTQQAMEQLIDEVLMKKQEGTAAARASAV